MPGLHFIQEDSPDDIGRAIADRFALEGVAVAVADIDFEAASLACKEIEASGARAVPVACDVTDREAAKAAVEDAKKKHGRLDILVNKEPVDTLSYLVHRDKARTRALHYCEQLAEAIPRHQFKIPVQGVIGGTDAGDNPSGARVYGSLGPGLMAGDDLLQSWKEIAAHLGRSERTCRRWETEFKLPVHRMDGSVRGSVFAYKTELERWMDEVLHKKRRGPPSKKRLASRRSLIIIPALAAIAAIAVATAIASTHTATISIAAVIF